MSPPMYPVSSSMLSFIEYSEDTKELYVTFKNGTTYMYQGVSKETFEEFKNSSSIGKYYLSNIKGAYPSSKTN